MTDLSELLERPLGKKLRKKQRLFERQSGLCYYCGEPMRLILGSLPPRTKTPDDLATFEHLDDRYSAERGAHPGEYRVVLAHHICNGRRGQQRTAERSLDELQERSGRLSTLRALIAQEAGK